MTDEILVLGCGSIGERHLRCLQQTGRAQVCACDANAELARRIAEKYGVASFSSLEAALAARAYGGIAICTPAHTHLPLALAALRHGANVLIEKPLSISLEQTAEVGAEIARTRKFVGVAYVYHFMPWVRAARTILRGGELGRPLQASVVSGQHFPTFRPAYREIYYPRHETGGGAIQDALTHLANAVEWLIGPATRIFCEAAHQALEGVDVEDTVCVTARHGEVLASYAMNQFQAPNETTLLIHCERGSVKIEAHTQRCGVLRHGEAEWQWQQSVPLERDALFTAQSNAFLDGLHGAPTDLCTFEEAVQTLRFNLAALESMRRGQPITLR